MAVILETSLGDITIDLYTEERPRCSLNFLKLCKIKYYNFCLFHSVQRNLVAQTGDPTGTGKGGQSIYSKLYGEQAAFFEPEYKPRIKHKKLGTVSMVNNGKTLHGSQFFITTGSDLDYLDGVHTVFGEVSEGHDVLQKINESITDEEHRPYQDIRIFHTVVLDDPYDDSPEIAECIPDRSPEPTKEQLTSNRIGVDEDVDAMDGKSAEEMAKILSEREAKANAQILEMVGDLPDADVAPEDNVLFVCKLNPVTTEDDLEIIFSRFGAIKGCEVIKDKKTGESLQYAFIEFTKVADCENAYFKMDNVIIDDRRIHVDFSQSVAKVKWKNKGKGEKQDDGDKDKPSFIIKDKSRRDDRYSLVFSDEEEGGSKVGKKKHKKKKKKHKKQKDSSSESSDNEQTTHRGKRKDRVTSRSPSPAQKKHHTDRQKQTRRSSDGDRKTDKDRTRDRSVDRDRSPDQEKTVDRERTRERSHDHARHKGKDRDRDKRDDKYDDRSRNRDRNRNKDRPRDGDRKRDRY